MVLIKHEVYQVRRNRDIFDDEIYRVIMVIAVVSPVFDLFDSSRSAGRCIGGH